jgi:hypothetical protein
MESNIHYTVAYKCLKLKTFLQINQTKKIIKTKVVRQNILLTGLVSIEYTFIQNVLYCMIYVFH